MTAWSATYFTSIELINKNRKAKEKVVRWDKEGEKGKNYIIRYITLPYILLSFILSKY